MSALDVFVLDGATVTASGSKIIPNPGAGHPKFMLNVNIPNAPTGTSPTLVFEVDSSPDGVASYTRQGAALATLNAVSNQRTLYSRASTQGALVGQFLKVAWTIGGSASPTFTGVTVKLTGLDC